MVHRHVRIHLPFRGDTLGVASNAYTNVIVLIEIVSLVDLDVKIPRMYKVGDGFIRFTFRKTCAANDLRRPLHLTKVLTNMSAMLLRYNSDTQVRVHGVKERRRRTRMQLSRRQAQPFLSHSTSSPLRSRRCTKGKLSWNRRVPATFRASFSHQPPLLGPAIHLSFLLGFLEPSYLISPFASTHLEQIVEEWSSPANGGARCAEGAHGLHVGKTSRSGPKAGQLHLLHIG